MTWRSTTLLGGLCWMTAVGTAHGPGGRRVPAQRRPDPDRRHGVGRSRQLRRHRRPDAEHRQPRARRRADDRLLLEWSRVHADPCGSACRVAISSGTGSRCRSAVPGRRRAISDCRRTDVHCRSCWRQRGYATALVGKWHLGYRPEFSPAAHGFGYFFGLKSGYHDFYAHTGGDGKPDLWENDAQVAVERLHHRPHHRSIDPVPRAAGGAAVLPRDRVQRAALAVPAAGAAVGGGWQRAARAAVGRVRRARVPTTWRWSSTSIAVSATCCARSSASISRGARSSSSPTTTAASGCRATGRSSTGRRASGRAASACPPWSAGPGASRRARCRARSGITMDLTASILAATGRAGAGRRRASTAWTCCRCSRGARPRCRGRCSGARATRPSSSGRCAAATGSWCSTAAVRSCSTCGPTPASGENLTHEQQDVARRLWPLLDAWEKDVDAEWKASGVERAAVGSAVTGGFGGWYTDRRS